MSPMPSSNSSNSTNGQLQFLDRQTLIEELPVAIYSCALDGTVNFFNKKAEELWGRRPILGKDLWCGSWNIYDPDGNPMEFDECPMAITLRSGVAVTGKEIIVERPDGHRLNVLPNPMPIFDDAGKLCGVINTLLDVTETRRNNKIIRESEAKYRQLAESLEIKVEERTDNLKKSEERYHKMIEEVQDYAIILLDVDGKIMNWNMGAEKIKGYSEKEILGKNFRIFYQPEDQKSKLPESLINEAIKNNKAVHEGWRLRKDGTKFWGNIVITALHDDLGNVIGFSKVTRDLTERKYAEDRMHQDAKDIEFQNKQLEEYAYVASHDLQEPLRKIQIYSELLEANLDNHEKAKQHLLKINSSAKRMTTLIKDVLDYSQLLKSGELFVDTDLGSVIDNITEDFELLIKQKNGTIKYSQMPVIKCIPVQMHQLFSNLISNSIKFSVKEPVVEITSEKILNGQVGKYPQLNSNFSYYKLTLKDNGIGFDPQYAAHAFKMFQRLHSNMQGTGIGLALCKKIVENHDGHISVTTELNVGTTFDIFLPI